MSEKPELRGARLETEGRIARLVLDRDDVRNELTGTKLYEAIVETVDWINSGEEISVLVITGTGKSFSAGGNVKDMHERRGAFDGDVYELQAKYRTGIQMMATAMHRLDVPSIAQINGAAIGAGLDLACMCDLRIASDRARFGQPEILLGIIPGGGGTQRLARLVGPSRAKDLVFTGRQVDADEALAIGLVNEVVPHDELRTRTLALATSLAVGPRRAIALAKAAISDGIEGGLDAGLDLEEQAFVAAFATSDAAVGVGSFRRHGPGKAGFSGR